MKEKDIKERILENKIIAIILTIFGILFGASFFIQILTIQSYPIVGNPWVTDFNTIGKGNLKITPSNGTLFDKDLEFVSLKCGDNIVEPTELTDLYVKFDNYYCFSESHFEVKVLSSGKHTLRFEFGSEVDYSYNEATFEKEIVWKDNCQVRCVDGKCNTMLGRTIWVNDSDGTCKPIEKAKSLKNGFFIEYLETDPSFNLTVNDFNISYMNMTLNFEGNPEDYLDFCQVTDEFNAKCDFKLDEKWNEYDEEGNLTEKKQLKFQYKWEMKHGIVTKRDKVKYEYKENPFGKKFSFGGNSTTIQLQDADTENLNDAYTSESSSTFDWTANNPTVNYISDKYTSRDWDAWDTHSTYLIASKMGRRISYLLEDYPNNLTNVKVKLSDCKSATTLTSKVWADNSSRTELYSGSTISCASGSQVDIPLGYSNPKKQDLLVGFEANSDVNISVDTGSETNDWEYYNNSWNDYENVALEDLEVYFEMLKNRAFIQFNTSQIPDVSTIDEVLLSFKVSTQTGWIVDLHEAGKNISWDENTIVNTTLSINSSVLDSQSITLSNVWVIFDVTNGSLESTDNNITYSITANSYSNSNERVGLYTKELSGTVNDPYLNITYTEDNIPPTYSDNSTNTTLAGAITLFSLKWIDSYNLSGYTFSFYNGTNTTKINSSEKEDGTQNFKGGFLTNYETSGLTSIGGSQGYYCNNYYVGSRIVANTTGDVSTTSVYLTVSETNNCKMGVYNTTKALLGNSSEREITSTGWHNFTYPIPVSVVDGTSYDLMVWCDGSITQDYTRYDATGDYTWLYDSSAYGVWEEPGTYTVSINREPSMYLVISFEGAVDNNTNKTAVKYLNIFDDLYNDIKEINITIYVNYYSTLGSIVNGNNNITLWLEVYNGSDWINEGDFLVGTIGNYTKLITTDSILNGWSNELNTDIKISARFVDYYNSTHYDEINWTDVWVIVNSSQEFLNDSSIGFSGTINWSNVTKTISSNVGDTIKWKVHANDTSGNWNNSETFSYVTTSAAEDTCNPASPLTADHIFDCNDNCSQDATLNANGYNIIWNNAGNYYLEANIENVKNMTIANVCNFYKGKGNITMMDN